MVVVIGPLGVNMILVKRWRPTKAQSLPREGIGHATATAEWYTTYQTGVKAYQLPEEEASPLNFFRNDFPASAIAVYLEMKLIGGSSKRRRVNIRSPSC